MSRFFYVMMQEEGGLGKLKISFDNSAFARFDLPC